MTATAPSIIAEFERRGSRKGVEGMARYGIVAKKAHGVSVGELRAMAKRIGRDHVLAAKVWKTGSQEGRMVAAMIDDPGLVTSRQMDAWARDFENWADCDHACFHLFDRTPLAWKKIEQWSTRKDELVKRASFALLASVALHDKKAPDAPFIKSLKLIERAADDDRNFVKKGAAGRCGESASKSEAEDDRHRRCGRALGIRRRLGAMDRGGCPAGPQAAIEDPVEKRRAGASRD